MALSPLTGYVQVDGVAKTADQFSSSFRQIAVDRSNYTTEGEPLNSAGQKSGQFTCEGPYEGVIGISTGNVYAFTAGITALISATVNARVTEFEIFSDHQRGPRWRCTAEQTGAAVLNL